MVVLRCRMLRRAASLIVLLFASACGSSTSETAPAGSEAAAAAPAPAPAPVVEAEPPSQPEPPPPEVEPDVPVEPSVAELIVAPPPLRHKLSGWCVIRSDELLCWDAKTDRGARRVELDSKPVSVSGRCALLESGAVVCVEPNGKLSKLAELEGVSALASSEVSTCGVREGEVICRHANGKRSVMHRVTDAVDVVLNQRWGCAVRAGGKVSCWDLIVEDPTRTWVGEIQDLSNAVEVDIGPTPQCARTEAGELFCWDYRNLSNAKKLEGLERVTDVVTSYYASCALVDGAVFCWSSEDYPFQPVRMLNIENAVALARDSLFCALQADDRVKCWAPYASTVGIDGLSNPVWSTNVAGARMAKFGKLGPIVLTEAGKLEVHDPVWAHFAPELAQLSDVADFTISSKYNSLLCVITRAGDSRCWTIGNGEVEQWAGPKVELRDIFIPERDFHMCGISTDGQLVCLNDEGAQQIDFGDELGTIVDGGVWLEHRCAVDSEGMLLCAGVNTIGRLGQGHTEDMSDKRVTPKGVSDVVEVDGNDSYTCARTQKGRVRCWGAIWAVFGGSSERTKFRLPRDIGVSGAVQISVDDGLACARDQDNTVWCWMEYARETAAEDTFVKPYKVPALRGSTDIRVNRGRVCGVQDSDVRCWWSGEENAWWNYMTLPVEIALPDADE